MSVLLVVLVCESLHVCTVCIWRCEYARFCVEVFYVLYINFYLPFIIITVVSKICPVVASDQYAEKELSPSTLHLVPSPSIISKRQLQVSSTIVKYT